MAQKTAEALQNPEIQHALDSMSYKMQMREAERAFFDKNLFKRKIATDMVHKEE